MATPQPSHQRLNDSCLVSSDDRMTASNSLYTVFLASILYEALFYQHVELSDLEAFMYTVFILFSAYCCWFVLVLSKYKYHSTLRVTLIQSNIQGNGVYLWVTHGSSVDNSYSGHTGTWWGVPLGDPRVIRRYYGTIVTLGILVRAGVYLWVPHRSSLDTMVL